MGFKKKVVWLCTGDILGRKQKNKPCLYARISVQQIDVPLFASSSYTRKAESLFIYCSKKFRNVEHWVKECPDFQNSTLEQHL